MRPATKPRGFEYYEYVLIHVDDILVISGDPDKVLTSLSSIHKFKEDQAGLKWSPPDRHLGADMGQSAIPDDTRGKHHWHMSSDTYTKDAIKTVESKLEAEGRKLSTRADTPLSTNCRPGLDITEELDLEGTNYYQNLIGVLRWAVELGRVDIHVAVALMSQYLVFPRRGHLDQVSRIFGYLKRCNRSKMVFDDAMIDWKDKFYQADWSDFCPDAKEELPARVPKPRGLPVQLNCFVDADHAGDKVTRRSHSGVLLFLNRAPITWCSKRQNTVETSTFGSEFVAMKIATELVVAMRHKLRMMGVEVDGPCNMFCDDQSVVSNSAMPESTLKKKHVSICCHKIRESAAAGIIRVAKEKSETNLADTLTKILPAPRLRKLIGESLH